MTELLVLRAKAEHSKPEQWTAIPLFASVRGRRCAVPAIRIATCAGFGVCAAGFARAAIRQRCQVPANQQGELQGAVSSLRSITACIAPLMMTGLFSYFTSTAAPFQFPGASFLAASVLTFAALLMVLSVLRRHPVL